MRPPGAPHESPIRFQAACDLIGSRQESGRQESRNCLDIHAHRSHLAHAAAKQQRGDLLLIGKTAVLDIVPGIVKCPEERIPNGEIGKVAGMPPARMMDAVHLAGLFVGNEGMKYGVSERSRDHLQRFWSLFDEVLNSVLFLLIGLEVLIIAVALALSLPANEYRPFILSITYVVVVFSIIVQGLTIARLTRRVGPAQSARSA